MVNKTKIRKNPNVKGKVKFISFADSKNSMLSAKWSRLAKFVALNGSFPPTLPK